MDGFMFEMPPPGGMVHRMGGSTGYTSFQDVLSKDFLGDFCGKCCLPFACARIMEPCPAHKAQDKADEIRLYLMENFKRQAEGAYTGADAMQSIPVILGFLKPEHVDEVQGVMKQFASGPRA